MQEISLLASLGVPDADAAVQELIRVYEESFPEQIVCYYIEGSYADHSYLATSDIDLTIVFQYAVRKRACVQLYHQYINDEWSSFLEDLTAFCQQKWHYLLPETEVDRQHLRSLCERALDFEEHFLTHYKLYLLAQLQSEEQESRRFAHWIQEQLPLDDAEIREVLQSSSSKSTKSGLHLE